MDKHVTSAASVRAPAGMRPDELERLLRERLDALGPAPRAELLHVLMLPDLERADVIGSYWGNPRTRTFAELLISLDWASRLPPRRLTSPNS
jgi:hypothetical protein